MAKETAEQKLLKLIEEAESKEGGAPVATVAPVVSAEAQKTLAAVQSLNVPGIALPPFLSNFLQGLRHPQAVKLGIPQLNKLFVVVIFVIGGFFISDFMKNMRQSQRPIDFAVVKMIDSKTGLTNIATNIRDLSEYLSIVTGRNIFQPYEAKVEPVTAEGQAAIDSQVIEDKIANFRLVGVSWLDSPETVTAMIEDKQTQVTHFLKIGDEYQEVKIEKIFADHIELSYQGHTTLLRM